VTPLSPPLVYSPRGDLPVLLSVPHSGRDYPDWLIANARDGRSSLEVLEDPWVDRLVWRARERGVGVVIARAPRAAVDCNRSEDEIDPAVVEGGRRHPVSARARGGLGIVPARTQRNGFLWRRPISGRDLEARLDQAHRPYHQALRDQLGLIFDRFGCALLIDCHSMPPAPDGVASVVIGDCRGRSASGWLSAEALRIVRDQGYEAALNDPFAGGHIIAQHSAPHRDVHALQLELDRTLYLDEALEAPGPGFDAAAELIDSLVGGLGRALLARPRFATAAE